MADALKQTLDRESRAVLEGLPDHPAVKALLAWNADALTDAQFDRGELTLDGRPRIDLRAPAAPCKHAGYNFFEDMTAVDWFPSEPRFQFSYHILSHAYKERIRLRAWVDEYRSCNRVDHRGLAWRQLFRARSLRSVRSALRRPSLSAAHPDAGRLGRPSAAQGLSGGGLPLMVEIVGTPILEGPTR